MSQSKRAENLGHGPFYEQKLRPGWDMPGFRSARITGARVLLDSQIRTASNPMDTPGGAECAAAAQHP